MGQSARTSDDPVLPFSRDAVPLDPDRSTSGAIAPGAPLPDMVFVKDARGVYLACNPRVGVLSGTAGGEVVGRSDEDVFAPEVARQMRATDQRAVAQGTPCTDEAWVTGLDGRPMLLETVKSPMYDPDGTLIGILGIARDITQRDQSRVGDGDRSGLDARAEQDRLSDAFEAVRAATWERYLPTDRIQVDERWERLLGHAPDREDPLTAAVWSTWLHPDDAPIVDEAWARLLSGEAERFEAEYRVRHRDGRWVWFRDLGRVMERTAAGSPSVVRGIVIDVSGQKAQQEQLDFVAEHDGLTGLFSRQRFAQHLRDEVARCRDRRRGMALVALDLDGFEAINHAHGRAAGNQLLVELANRLLTFVGDRRHVARIGGDEFAVILHEGPGADDWRARVHALSELLAQPVRIQGRELVTTASIGVTVLPQPRDVDAEQLLRQVDQAAYQAKLAGKNRYELFDLEHDEHRRVRYERIEQVRAALSGRQFVLHFQPQVNMRTGEVLGFEALIRWQHPEQGLLLPETFIPLLADHPLAIELGDWVIEAALRQLDTWSAAGLTTSVSVNVDALQLHDPGFLKRLEHQLRTHPEVAPRRFAVEILETGALEDLEHVSTLVFQLQDLGVTVALDDFGTGYSSLTFLKQLAARFIKIDRSFVVDLLADPEHAVIVDSIVGLARNFQREVLAEGVETEVHGALLLELGCELGQGYGIARPMPGDEAPGWVAGWTPPTTWTTTRPLPVERVPALLAELEHRAWRAGWHAYVRGDAQAPMRDHEPCRLTRWLEEPRPGDPTAALVGLREQHDAARAQARRLVAAHEAGDRSEELALLGELDRLGDVLLDGLRSWRHATDV